MNSPNTEENRQARKKRQKRYGTSTIGDDPSNAHALGRVMRRAGIRIPGIEDVTATPQKAPKNGDKKSKRRNRSPRQHSKEATMADPQNETQTINTPPPVNTEAQATEAKAAQTTVLPPEMTAMLAAVNAVKIPEMPIRVSGKFEPLPQHAKRKAITAGIYVGGALIVGGGLLYGLHSVGAFARPEVTDLPELPVGGEEVVS